MSTTNNGGPAFPHISGDASGIGVYNDYGGLSKREYFAAKVLAGFCANPAVFASNPNHGWGLVNCTDADIVGYAYHLADSMVECGQTKPTPSTPKEQP